METDPRFQPTWLLRAVCRGHGRGFSEFVGWSVGETASIKPSLDRRTQPPTRSTHGYDGGKRASGRHGARARTLGTPLAPLAALAAGASHSRRHRIGLTDPAQQTNAHPTKWPELEKNQLGTERRNSFFVETSEQSPQAACGRGAAARGPRRPRIANEPGTATGAKFPYLAAHCARATELPGTYPQ
jgi:hypothetical protein